MCLTGLSVSSIGIYFHKSLTPSQEKVPSSSEAHPPPPAPPKWLCSPLHCQHLPHFLWWLLWGTNRTSAPPLSRSSCDIGEQSVGFSKAESSVLSVASALFKYVTSELDAFVPLLSPLILVLLHHTSYIFIFIKQSFSCLSCSQNDHSTCVWFP